MSNTPSAMPDLLASIPDPITVHRLIGQRAAELLLLRKLLKLAESLKRAKALNEAILRQTVTCPIQKGVDHE